MKLLTWRSIFPKKDQNEWGETSPKGKVKMGQGSRGKGLRGLRGLRASGAGAAGGSIFAEILEI